MVQMCYGDKKQDVIVYIVDYQFEAIEDSPLENHRTRVLASTSAAVRESLVSYKVTKTFIIIWTHKMLIKRWITK